MIPAARTTRPEAAANLILATYRQVLVQAHYDNLDSIRIRFRADLIQDERVFFGKVPSQIKKWREQGGLLISWRSVDEREGPHDALLFAECPKSIEAVYRSAMLTRHLAVIYQPPTWRAHEETVARRQRDRGDHRYTTRMERLNIVRDYVAALPDLTRPFLRRRSRDALAASSRQWCAPVSPAGAALPSGTPR